MNRKKIADNPLDLTRLKHVSAVRIDNELYTVKYGAAGDYLLYHISGSSELIGGD